MTEKPRLNARDLERELTWIAGVIDRRFQLYFNAEAELPPVVELKPPDLDGSESPWANFLQRWKPSFSERLALVLALVPHLRPRLLDVFLTKNARFDCRFSELGGRRKDELEFWPTGDTLAFLLAADDLEDRFAVPALFGPDHFFARHNILRLEEGADCAPMKTPLLISREYLGLFTTGEAARPDFGPAFPARYVTTGLEWGDLVLHPETRRQIGDIHRWLTHGHTLMDEWGMAPKLRPGYRALFFGPPGTGKTMTACLLGNSTQRDVYRIDLSLVISKYIGETEKNLARVFDQAQNRGWILFFDEADALFGRRSATKDARDRYANQEVSFLLQRIETFDGVAILASNQRENLDDAFTRRFESMIHFPVPHAEEREQLWRQSFPPLAELEEALDLAQLAREHVLSGGSILNVVRRASLDSIAEGTQIVTLKSVLEAIRHEQLKEGNIP